MTKMTSDRLIALIDAWGADIQAFPEAERAPARALIAASNGAFDEAIAQARALDALFLTTEEIVPSSTLTDALIASAPKAKRAPVKRFDFSSLWPFAGATAALALGLSFGLIMPTSASTSTAATDQVDQLVETAFGLQIYAGLDEEIGQ